MSQNLPAIQVQCGVPDREAIKSFLKELEAVADSCNSVVSDPAAAAPEIQTSREPDAPSENYLDEIAKKYSFAPPRRTFYKCDEAAHQSHTSMPSCLPKTTANSLPAKPIVPSGIMWQVNKTYKALLSSFSTIHRKQ
jgi:hypothetical protein